MTQPLEEVFARPRSITPAPEFTEDTQTWNHPLLALFESDRSEYQAPKPKLYLVRRTRADEEAERFPQATSANDLPELTSWIGKFSIAVLEIWAGKRHPQQLLRWCDRGILLDLQRKIGSHSEIGKVRKLYINEPLDGLCEATVTVKLNSRIRSLVMRFEGVDQRWLCTELFLI